MTTGGSAPQGPDPEELTVQEIAALPALIKRAREFDVLRDFEVLVLARAASSWNPCSGIFAHKWLDPECVASGCKSLAALPARAPDPDPKIPPQQVVPPRLPDPAEIERHFEEVQKEIAAPPIHKGADPLRDVPIGSSPRLPEPELDQEDAVRVEFPSGNWFGDFDRAIAAELIALWNAQADSNQEMVVTDRGDVELALRIAQARPRLPEPSPEVLRDALEDAEELLALIDRGVTPPDNVWQDHMTRIRAALRARGIADDLAYRRLKRALGAVDGVGA